MEKLFSVEAEQALLGSIIYDPECASLVGQLVPSDFSASEHCEIFAWVQNEVAAGRRPSAVALLPVIGTMKVGPITGRDYLPRLASVAHRPTVREALATVKGLSARRQIAGIAEFLTKQAHAAAASPREISLEAIEGLNIAIASERKPSPAAAMVGEVARDLVDTLDDPDDDSMISTGLRSLDRAIGGWPRGELSLVAGRPSMGKSAVLAAAVRRAAKKGQNILFFSLEMPRKTVTARMLSDFAYTSREDMRVPYAGILRKELNPWQKQRLASALDQFNSYNIKIDDQRGLTMSEIRLRGQRYADELDRKGERLDLVVIDHLGKVSASDRYRGNMVAETGEKSDAMMSMAYDLNTGLVAASQLSRGPEGREDKRPGMSDLRNSGDLEQDSNIVLFPYRQAYYLERQKFDDPDKDHIRQATLEKKKNLLELLIGKSRNGSCETVDVFVDMGSNHVEDFSYAA